MISFILPFWKKFALFKLTYPLNNAYWNEEAEVVCVLDDPEDEQPLVAFAKEHPETKWRIVVNDKTHEWRPPCVSYNVGIQNSKGTHCVLFDPESILVTPIPDYLWTLTRQDFRRCRTGICWHVIEWEKEETPDMMRRRMLATEATASCSAWAYYFLLAHKFELNQVRGYDESRVTYGWDDNDIRIRLTRLGVITEVDPLIRIFHLYHENPWDRLVEHVPMTPQIVLTQQEKTWGREFNRIAFDWNTL